MAETALASSRFWQIWAVLASIGTALAGARLLHAASPKPAHAATVTQADARSKSPTLPPPMFESEPPRAPVVDRLLARLAVAVTASERCSLLERVQPSDDVQATYAITAVLDRAQFASVRVCATQALGRQPTTEARSWLVDLADDPEPEVHGIAFEQLAVRDEAARAVVVEAAHSEDLERRVSAVKALLKAKRAEGHAAAVQVLPLIEDAETLSSLIDALGESHDPQALPALEGLMETADRESHLHAIGAIGELGVISAAQRLAGFLQIGSNEEFSAAAEALKKLVPERAGALLRTVLEADDSERQALALSAMLSLQLPDLPSILRKQLESGDRKRVSLVLRHLVSAPDPSFEADLIAVAEGEGRRPQILAIQALSKLDTPSARAAVQRLASALPESFAQRFALQTEDDLARARERRIVALSKVGDEHPAGLFELARDPALSAQDAVLRYLAEHEARAEIWAAVTQFASASTVQKLIDQRATSSAAARAGLLQGLAQRGDPQFAAALRADLHADPVTRDGALTALARLGDDSVLPALRQLAKSDDVAERDFAAQLLSERSDPEAMQELERLAADPETQVVSSVLHALQGRSPELVLRVAERALREAPAEDRANVLSSLSDLKPSLSRPLLERSLNDAEDSVAVQAIQALSNLQGPASAQRLLAVVTDSNRSEEVRREAASGLRSLGGPLARANRALIDSLSDPSSEAEYVCNPN